jgi:CRP-like cAMP-binding protein
MAEAYIQPSSGRSDSGASATPNAFIQKVSLFAPLSDADRNILQRICSTSTTIKAHQDLIRESEVPGVVHLILTGFACRYKVLPAGTRSIMAYLVPGDMCDWHAFVLREMDHSIATLSPCQVVEIPRATVLEITDKHPAITRALWWMALVDEAVLREWIVNVSRRSAEESVAHLFCELLARLESVGLRIGDGFEFPITQSELADTVGISTVHANRVLQSLRAHGLIELNTHGLQILNIEALKELAGFRPNYLHLSGGKGRLA